MSDGPYRTSSRPGARTRRTIEGRLRTLRRRLTIAWSWRRWVRCGCGGRMRPWRYFCRRCYAALYVPPLPPYPPGLTQAQLKDVQRWLRSAVYQPESGKIKK